MSKILFIEEDQKWRDHLKKALVPLHDLSYWPDGKDFLALLRRAEFEIILLTVRPGQADGFGLLEQIKSVNPYTPVVVTSDIEEASLIVEAIKKGAFDFVPMPFSKEKIELSIKRALENRHLKNEIDYLRREQDIIYDFDRITAHSQSMKQVIATLSKYAKTDSTILITGETGTGKSFLSGSVHFNSARRSKPFININCANIPENLLESELFGHEKGAFTGANKTRVGRLEQGKDGTVLLDEIGEMSPALQAKLLRVLEEKSFERVGGNKTIHSDVRVVAATNKEPEDLVAEGKFREDLYYRINVLRVHLPALRERKECIEPLAVLLLDKACRKLKKKIEGFSSEALEALRAYRWPGNIRELANTIERASILEESNLIQVDSIMLPESIKAAPKEEFTSHRTMDSIKDKEKEMVVRALEECLWVQKEAASLLGISPRVLNYKIKSLGITHGRWRKNK